MTERSDDRGREDLWVLRIVEGEDLDLVHGLVDAETTIGRGSDMVLRLTDVATSRKHVLVTREGNHHRVTDLGSSNGTLVNGRQVLTAILSEGDEIKIGNTRMRYEHAPTWDSGASTALETTLKEDERAPEPPPAPAPSIAAVLADEQPGGPEPSFPPEETRLPERPLRRTEPPEEEASRPRHERLIEVATNLIRDAVIEEAPAAAPPPPAEEGPDESSLPAPIVARLEEGWHVRVGDVLSARNPDLAGLIDACSGLAWVDRQLVAAHAHADYVEFIDPSTLARKRYDLPRLRARAEAGMRAAAELQIEAVMGTRDYRGEFLLAFGAGTTEEYQRIVRMRVGGGEFDLTVTEARWLYRVLGEVPGFATSPLNIEAVAWIRSPGGPPPFVRLCQRASSRARGRARATSATIDILQVVLLGYLERCRKNPAAKLGDDLVNLRRYDLGSVENEPYGFTDACGLPDGRMLYVAVAGDGLGTVLGLVEPDGTARQAPIREPDGRPTRANVAALTVDGDWRVYAALQATADEGPRLCRLELGTMPVRPPLKI